MRIEVSSELASDPQRFLALLVVKLAAADIVAEAMLRSGPNKAGAALLTCC